MSQQKDPAILWYPKDFIIETMFLSFEDRGKLMLLRAHLHQHGRLSLPKVRLIVGEISDDLLKFLKVDKEGNYYCEIIEQRMKERADFKKRKSSDGKKGNRVKEVMKEHGMTAEEARKFLTMEEGLEFGKNKYKNSTADYTPGATPSARKKGDAIGNEDGNTNEIERLEELNDKFGRGMRLTGEQKQFMISCGLSIT